MPLYTFCGLKLMIFLNFSKKMSEKNYINFLPCPKKMSSVFGFC